MASNFDPTLVSKGWYVAAQKDLMQKNELREQSYGILQTAFANQNILLSTNELNAIRTAAKRPVSIALLKKRTDAAETARACGASGNSGSAEQTVSWGTISMGFNLGMDQLMGGNQFDFNSVFIHELSELRRAMDEAYEAAGYAFLISKKTLGAGSLYTPGAGTDRQVPLTDYTVSGVAAALWLNKVRSEMIQNKYNGPFDVIGDPVMASVAAGMLNQGQGNAINTGFQFQGFNFKTSNTITNDAGEYASAFIMQNGMFTSAPWIKPKNKMGIAQVGNIPFADNSGGWLEIGNEIWGQVAHPIYGFPIEVKIKLACKDNSADYDESQDDLDVQVRMSYDYTWLSAYSSVNTNSGIYKYELSAS